MIASHNSHNSEFGTHNGQAARNKEQINDKSNDRGKRRWRSATAQREFTNKAVKLLKTRDRHLRDKAYKPGVRAQEGVGSCNAGVSSAPSWRNRSFVVRAGGARSGKPIPTAAAARC